MIRERERPYRIVSLHLGVLKVLARPYAGAGYLWLCVKKNGWYGFQNLASGMWLGHDGNAQIRATQPHHRGDEYFTVERHQDGGYVLCMRHGEVLRQVVISNDGQWRFLTLATACIRTITRKKKREKKKTPLNYNDQ
ncbi:hypothetical protein V8C35DRAFT_296533 [Trichoderma chlorosporum]